MAVAFRAMGNPDLPWAQLLNEKITISDAKWVNPDALIKPWIQWISKRKGINEEAGWIWKRWMVYSSANIDKLISLKEPETAVEVLNMYIWYHPKICRGVGDSPAR